jgi:hypothetical protein
MTRYNIRFCTALLVCALAACVESPTSLGESDSVVPQNSQPLADTFDEFARQAAEDGDNARYEEFTYAALAVRNGVIPSRLEVRDGNSLVYFDAIVTTAEWQVAENVRPPAVRSLIAWRRGDDGLVRLLSVGLASDSAALRNPISLGANAPGTVFAIASATYRETTISRPPNATVPEALWVGVSGFARIRQVSSGANCTVNTAQPLPKGISCSQAGFSVGFGITFQQVNVRPSFQVNSGTAVRTMTALGGQPVNGYKLTFTCLRVSSRNGCG